MSSQSDNHFHLSVTLLRVHLCDRCRFFLLIVSAAVDRNDVGELERLLSCQSSHSRTELTSALQNAVLKRSDGYSRCVELLLSRGANADDVDGFRTPFHVLAADAGCIEVLSLLTGAKCDVNRRRRDGATALHRAALHDHVSCVRHLLSASADATIVDSHGRTALLVAAEADNIGALTELLKGDADTAVDAPDDDGRTVTHWAVFHQNTVAIRLLVAAGADVNVRDSRGFSPLMVAAQQGNADIVEILVNNGACVDLESVEKETALLLAAANKHLACVGKLVDLGADVNASNDRRETALLYAIHDADTATHLLHAGADANVATNDHVSPLSMAVQHGYVDVIRHLLQANCDPTVAGPSGSLLEAAIYSGSIPTVKLLFRAIVSRGAHTQWLHRYLDDENMHRQMALHDDVRETVQWLTQQLFLREHEPPQLIQCCRHVVREQIGSRGLVRKIDELPLPATIRSFLKLDELVSLCRYE